MGNSSWGWSRQKKGFIFKAMCETLVASKHIPFAALTTFCKEFEEPNPHPRRALLGCQVKMMVGHMCHEPYLPDEKQVKKAVNFVQTQMSFVGLFERYVESVCLWHARFGSTVWDFEVFDQKASREMPREVKQSLYDPLD